MSLAQPRLQVSRAVEIAQALIRHPSVTPAEAGALDVLESLLTPLGFVCHRLVFGEVDNLFARWGTGAPHLCFAGHVDVVPVGEIDRWSVDPFDAVLAEGLLIGRGAADMKGAVAAMVAAAEHVVPERPVGSLSFLITCDEEGPATDGTRMVLPWMAAHGHVPDLCLVGEPTNPGRLGEMIKIGRRGSLNAHLTVRGAQGHVAYPHLADNPIPKLLRLLAALDALVLDEGTAHFQPSTLAITSVDVGNGATNVIPGVASARFNIRFNDLHSGGSLEPLLRQSLDAVGVEYELDTLVTGEAFLTPRGPLVDALVAAIEQHTGRTPTLSTSGGTSDARFIKDYCPVVEFGLVGATMHKVDEQVAVSDIDGLTAIYADLLRQILTRS
ncbi:MAG: succinyl-diaminopimelate desuccinylase [Rhodothalassiaceae bacterium]